MEDFPNMCRVCEHQFNLIDILGPSNQNYLEMFLVCATVSVRIIRVYTGRFSINNLN